MCRKCETVPVLVTQRMECGDLVDLPAGFVTYASTWSAPHGHDAHQTGWEPVAYEYPRKRKAPVLSEKAQRAKIEFGNKTRLDLRRSDRSRGDA